ncbi:MAG TPA: metallophosphoesterase family protein [Candidatus Dormibacteraeota bacterium]|nr:metallophosphoesterase family protein [Candidatus Dormibacteraeota bacterium]
MRLAVISDVHGNLPALEAVLAEIRREKPDLIVSCGDVASGPMPAETIELLMTLRDVRFVRGNADDGLIDEFDGKPPAPLPGPFADWCARQITREQRDFLASFDDTVAIDSVDGVGRVLFCHATPKNNTDIFTVETPADGVRRLFGEVDANLVVCGHTHMQFDRMIDGLRVVNSGSVGMPYGEPGAYWSMLGPGVELKRTDYDRTAAARRIRAKDWPGAQEFAEKNVIAVPSADEAMGFFRKAAARLAS